MLKIYISKNLLEKVGKAEKEIPRKLLLEPEIKGHVSGIQIHRAVYITWLFLQTRGSYVTRMRERRIPL